MTRSDNKGAAIMLYIALLAFAGIYWLFCNVEALSL